MAGEKKSAVWKYFRKDESSEKAVCNSCGQLIAWMSTTANLKSHLKRKHFSIFKASGLTCSSRSKSNSSQVAQAQSSRIAQAQPSRDAQAQSSRVAQAQSSRIAQAQSSRVAQAQSSGVAQAQSQSSRVAQALSSRGAPAHSSRVAQAYSSRVAQALSSRGAPAHSSRVASLPPSKIKIEEDDDSFPIVYLPDHSHHVDIGNEEFTHVVSLPAPYQVQIDDSSAAGQSDSMDGTSISAKKLKLQLDNEDSLEKHMEEKNKKIDAALLDFCIDSLLPFSIFEERAFKKFCKWIPGYQLPTKKTLSNSLEETYSKVYSLVRDHLNKEVVSICLSADVWTSVNTDTCIAITGHYLTQQLDFKTVLLGVCHLNGNCTLEHIKDEVLAVVDSFGLIQRVNFVVTDTGVSNLVEAVTELIGWKHLRCYAHTLNEIVENAMEVVKSEVESVKEIVAQIRKSDTHSERLRNYQQQQNEEPKKLKQPADTRWNSTYHMLSRFVELEDAILNIDGKPPIPTIAAEDWKLYSQLCQILKPFMEMTASMTGEKYTTGGSVIVVTRCLKEACQELLSTTDLVVKAKETVEVLHAGLSERFEGLEGNEALSLCTFLDPRFKMAGFSDQKEAQKTKDRVRKLVENMITKEDQRSSSTSTAATIKPESKGELNPWTIFEKLVANNSSSSSTPFSKAIKEIDLYLSDGLLPRKTETGSLNCPLSWWKHQQYALPHLKEIFVNQCNIVATSIPFEKMFSKKGFNLNERRTRLETSKIDKIMFLNVNMPEERFETF